MDSDQAATPTLRTDAERGEQGETHFEWLARLVLEEDRRLTPFVYGERGNVRERRHWDLRAGLFARDRTRRALLLDG